MGGLTDVIRSDIIPLVSKVSPLLGSVLGSPFVGVALYLIAQTFGLHPQDINGMVQILGNKDAGERLREIEMQHKEMLTKIASTDYGMEIDDRKDARKYGIEYKDFLMRFSYWVTLGFFCALFALFLPVEMSEGGKNLLSMLVGMLASKWQTIIDFYFGSSRHNQGGLIK